MASSPCPFSSIRGNPRPGSPDRTAGASRRRTLHEGIVLVTRGMFGVGFEILDALVVRVVPCGMGIWDAMYAIGGALSMASPSGPTRSCIPLVNSLGT